MESYVACWFGSAASSPSQKRGVPDFWGPHSPILDPWDVDQDGKIKQWECHTKKTGWLKQTMYLLGISHIYIHIQYIVTTYLYLENGWLCTSCPQSQKTVFAEKYCKHIPNNSDFRNQQCSKPSAMAFDTDPSRTGFPVHACWTIPNIYSE